MFVITADQLRRALPSCAGPDDMAAALADAMLVYGIADDRDNAVAFLAQCAHESASFNRLEESLNYTAERLVQVWPKRFPTLAVAQPYQHNPHGLARVVYGGRMGNDTNFDGWNYRGRGILMITGRANYQRVGKLINDPLLVKCPDRLRNRKTAAMACAAWWASDARLMALAESGDADDFVSLTRIVNGGVTGLADRIKLQAAFYAVIGPSTT